LPYHEEPIESPISTPDIYEKYPLILITGRRTPTFYHSEHRQIPWLRQFEKEPYVEIHPDTAKEMGVENGEWVWIEGVRGRAKRKLKTTPVVHPKMAMALHGWWLPESDGKAPNFNGIWDLNLNQLIPMGHQGKSGFGGAPLKTMLCKIYPVKNNDPS
jgi:anaerobic selenocysteine-containing dehydrogenase